MESQQQSPLLRLPMELQLSIFEYAVLEDVPLLLNCGCDSSYSSIAEWQDDQVLWERSEKHPPVQPGLTRTCRLLRAVTLPIYYQHNAFRAHYCYGTDFSLAVRWLKAIGQANRLLIRDFALWDKNSAFDLRVPGDIKRVRRGEIVRGLGGQMQTLARKEYCYHTVVFHGDDFDYYDAVPNLFEG